MHARGGDDTSTEIEVAIDSAIQATGTGSPTPCSGHVDSHQRYGGRSAPRRGERFERAHDPSAERIDEPVGDVEIAVVLGISGYGFGAGLGVCLKSKLSVMPLELLSRMLRWDRPKSPWQNLTMLTEGRFIHYSACRYSAPA